MHFFAAKQATFILLLFLSSLGPAMAQQRQVVLELVLAVDTSSSVDEAEFLLQREGIAEAFTHPDLVSVIEGIGNAGIAVTLIEWAGTNTQETVVDWTLLTGRQSALLFSNRVREAPRTLSGMTDIGSVLRYATRQLDENQFSGIRRVVDVSGDGSSSVDTSEAARDDAIAKGITINGLVIFDKSHDLADLAEVDLIRHYSNKVIGGNGAFLMTATGFDDFRNAMLNKLLREILGTGLADLPCPARAFCSPAVE